MAEKVLIIGNGFDLDLGLFGLMVWNVLLPLGRKIIKFLRLCMVDNFFYVYFCGIKDGMLWFI